MKAFKVIGTFKMGKIKKQPFTKEVLAGNQNQAKEQILSNLGSKHKIKRQSIHISKVEEITKEDVQSVIVKGLLEQSK